MTTSTSIGQEEPPDTPQSGIDGEAGERKKDGDGSALNDDAGHDVTREDIESGNDQNVSADDLGRSGRTGKDLDDAIELGK